MTSDDLEHTLTWRRDDVLAPPGRRPGAGAARRQQRALLVSAHTIALVVERSGTPVAALLASTDARLATGRPSAGRRARLNAGRWVQRLTLLPTTGGLGRAAAFDESGGDDGDDGHDDGHDDGGGAQVVRVAVLLLPRRARSAGSGEPLLRAAAAEAAARGAARLELVAPWGSGAEAVAARCGWERSATRLADHGRLVTPMHRQLAGERTGGVSGSPA